MALTNQQFDRISREFEARRLSHMKDMQKKLNNAYAAYPRLGHIDEEVASLNMKKVRIRLGVSTEDGSYIDDTLADLSLERKSLLECAGFKDGVVEPEYDCPICKDTGFVDGKKCACFEKAAISLMYSSSNLEEILKVENFDNFNLNLYSDRITDPDNGRTAKENAYKAFTYAKEFVRDFDKERRNIYFFGKTGVGKTFLSHCIAKELIDQGKNVFFVSEAALIEIMEDNQFRTTDETKANAKLIYDCDLLVIDDFGASANNNFVSSVLLRVIEERQLNNKSTIITTNLSLEDLQDRYSDRIFSRIYSYYKIQYIFGNDIRICTK